MTPRIAIIGTGGSISTPARHELDHYEYGAFSKPLDLAGLLGMVPAVQRQFDVVPVDFCAVDSTAMDPAMWLDLDREIVRTAASDDSIAGIVVTHGTSTLEETAYFLHLATKVRVPVVIVGAQRPPNALGSDSGVNLLNALRVAAAPAARGLGVCVVMNGEVHCARDVAKTSNFSLQAFRTHDFGMLGNVDPDGTVRIDRRPARRHAPDTEFDVQALRDLPPVEIVYCYAGASGRTVEALVDGGARGIVFAGTPPGRPSPAQRTALGRATESGVLVVQGSRAGSGRVVQRSDDHALGFVGADTLSPQKARVLAMLALTRTNDLAEIQRMFSEY
jgi:L-asparaginase